MLTSPAHSSEVEDTIVVRKKGSAAEQLLAESTMKGRNSSSKKSDDVEGSDGTERGQKISSDLGKLVDENAMNTTADGKSDSLADSVLRSSPAYEPAGRGAHDFDTSMEDAPGHETKNYIFAKQLPSQMIQLGSHFAVGEKSTLHLERGISFSLPGRTNISFNAIVNYTLSTTLVTSSFYESYISNQKFPWIGNTLLSYNYNSLVPIVPQTRIHAGDPREAAEALRYKGVVPIPICFGDGTAPTLVSALVVEDIFPLSITGRKFHLALGWDFFYNSAIPYRGVAGPFGIELELPEFAPSVRIDKDTITINAASVFRYTAGKDPTAIVSVVFDEVSCLNTKLPAHAILSAAARIMLELKNAGNLDEDVNYLSACKVTKRTCEILMILLPLFHASHLRSSNGYHFNALRILCESPYCADLPQKLEEYREDNWGENGKTKIVSKDILQVLSHVLQESKVKLEVVLVGKEENKVARKMLAGIRGVKKPEFIKREYSKPRRNTPPLPPQVLMEAAPDERHVVDVVNANWESIRSPGTMGFMST